MLVTDLRFPSLVRELFLDGKFSLYTEQCWPVRWVETGKMKLSSFASCAVFLGFFVSLCCLTSNGPQGSPSVVLFLDS